MEWAEFFLLALGTAGFLIGFLITGEAWMGLSYAMLLIVAVMGFVVGSIVGDSKGRTREGAVLGLLFGPMGWLIVRLEGPRKQSV